MRKFYIEGPIGHEKSYTVFKRQKFNSYGNDSLPLKNYFQKQHKQLPLHHPLCPAPSSQEPHTNIYKVKGKSVL